MTSDPSHARDAARPRYETPLPPRPSTLWTAAQANDTGELTRLLDAGAAINDRDHRGYAPLMLAAYSGNFEALEVLLVRGADPDTVDLFGNTVLMGASFKGHLHIVQRLLAAGAKLDRVNHGGLDARGFALTFGRSDVFAALERAHVGARHA